VQQTSNSIQHHNAIHPSCRSSTTPSGSGNCIVYLPTTAITTKTQPHVQVEDQLTTLPPGRPMLSATLAVTTGPHMCHQQCTKPTCMGQQQEQQQDLLQKTVVRQTTQKHNCVGDCCTNTQQFWQSRHKGSHPIPANAVPADEENTQVLGSRTLIDHCKEHCWSWAVAPLLKHNKTGLKDIWAVAPIVKSSRSNNTGQSHPQKPRGWAVAPTHTTMPQNAPHNEVSGHA